MTDRYRVAVIGGGIVGCSVLYWLAKLGWRDTVLVEKRELTSGSTWHAAGNVTHFGHYPSITRLYVNSLRTYLAAQEESGQDVGFHQTGSLRLATTDKELAYYQSLEPLYRELDIPYAVLDPARTAAAHPLMNIDGVLGAAHTPADGHVDPSGATHAMAKSARALGAEIRLRSEVLEIVADSGSWRLVTQGEDIIADLVVLAASFWTRELALSLGLNLPLFPLQHHEVITGPVAALQDRDAYVPAVRDPVAPSNTRQERDGFLCGVYEAHPEFWALDGIPKDFAEELLPLDTERLEEHLLRVIDRIPSFGEAGIKTVNNGPICYTPDGAPLLGPVANHPGLWLASGFAIGIGTGGGSGEYLARSIVDGVPPYDLPIVHPSRFANDLSREACLEMIRKTYAAGYSLPDTD